MMRDAAAVLRDVFGFAAFRGQQSAAVDHVVAGGDALVLMPTGGGKSLCYQLPALVRPGTGIVVSPLIALMQDQVRALRLHGVAAAELTSSLSADEAAAVSADAAAGRLDLLYVAPERALSPSFLRLVDRLRDSHGIALLAIDEAHCVSQWGHDFRPEYLRLAELGDRLPGVPRVGLTATADAMTRAEIHEKLGLTEAVEFVSSFDRPNITYRVVERTDPRRQLDDFLRGRAGETGIVYCATRKGVEQTAARLGAGGWNARPYHAGMSSALRQQVHDGFQRDSGVIVVATIAFGMGIDKPDVRFVAHMDMPGSLESYYQETGRAGRDGEPAEAWMLYGLADVLTRRRRIEASSAATDHKRVESMQLDAMLGYAEATTCRRQILLHHFGEDSEPCGRCDCCLDPSEQWDATEAAQKVLSAAVRTGQHFGAAHLVDVLRGSSTERVRSHGHDRLPTFGVGADLAAPAWRAVTRQLVVRGYLLPDPERFGALRLTTSADPVLRGEVPLTMRRYSPPPPRRRSPTRDPSTASAPTTSGASSDLSPADEEVFQRLRAERAAVAAENGVPAYVVFHDSTLRALASSRPVSVEELLSVPGIGQAKADRYGERFLAALGQEG
jgi:ATP-dependent DNA helicase RecQ